MQLTVKTEYTSRPSGRNKNLPRASDDIIHARGCGMSAFQPWMLKHGEMSAKICCYSTPIYREAFHNGYNSAALQWLQQYMWEVSKALSFPFVEVNNWSTQIEIPS